MQVVNDGEFRRGSCWGRFVERLQGLVIGPARFRFRDDAGAESDFTAPIAAPHRAVGRRRQLFGRFVDIDRVGISPHCGFASTVAGNPLSEADMRAKLARRVEVADIVWG